MRNDKDYQTYTDFLVRSQEIIIEVNWDMKDLERVENSELDSEKCDKESTERKKQEPWTCC